MSRVLQGCPNIITSELGTSADFAPLLSIHVSLPLAVQRLAIGVLRSILMEKRREHRTQAYNVKPGRARGTGNTRKRCGQEKALEKEDEKGFSTLETVGTLVLKGGDSPNVTGRTATCSPVKNSSAH